jgi:hypothetical protein
MIPPAKFSTVFCFLFVFTGIKLTYLLFKPDVKFVSVCGILYRKQDGRTSLSEKKTRLSGTGCYQGIPLVIVSKALGC